MGHPLAPAGVAALSAAVLLTSCDAKPTVGACSVSVSSADLVQLRQQSGIADCTPKTLAVDPSAAASALPDLKIGCLGSTSTVALADIKGPAIINFWASSCGPCRKEMPALAAFAKQYAGQVSVVGVDYLDTYPGAALDLARQSRVTYPSLADPCGDLQQSSMNPPSALPTFYFVAADGTVSTPVAGGLDSVQQVVDLAAQHGITLDSAKQGG
ncbi:MAG TPA: TlpA disulfide reductase family protein [Nocardioides sp.]|nr:TlpA disulfide reductase family protein [Nocardioides sp.]